MRYITLPGLIERVSVIGLGAGARAFTPETYAQAVPLLDTFLAEGGNCIDTAPIYGFGASEKTLGLWLHERQNRESVVLVSKACHPPFDPKHPFSAQPARSRPMRFMPT